MRTNRCGQFNALLIISEWGELNSHSYFRRISAMLTMKEGHISDPFSHSFSTLPSHPWPHLTLPIDLFLVLSSLEAPPWPLYSCLTSMGHLSLTHISKISNLASMCERECVMSVFLGLCCLTLNGGVQLHPFTYKFHFLYSWIIFHCIFWIFITINQLMNT